MSVPVLLLTGAGGFLGRRLLPALAPHWRVIPASRVAAGADAIAIDLAEPASLRHAFDATGPTVVVHAAALADPDACERDPELAWRVNVEAVEVLAALCAQAKARLVHFSTDYVFDGRKSWYREDDIARPLSAYGRSKLASESAALSRCPSAVVLRLSNCYGRRLGAKRTYLDQWHDNLLSGRAVHAFTDQWRTPTAGDQLPEIVARLISRPDLAGVYHWGGADRTTRYEAALAYCHVMGYDERLVRPARAAEHHFDAPRPRDTSLDSSRLAATLGLAPTGLTEGFSSLKTGLS